jgi:hypothetical protein
MGALSAKVVSLREIALWRGGTMKKRIRRLFLMWALVAITPLLGQMMPATATDIGQTYSTP